MGMKTRTIKSILRKKIDEWILSIEDQEVRKLIMNNTIVTGGSIASMLLGEDVNDFDIYFRNKETVLAVARYYIARFSPKTKEGIGVKIYLADELGKEIDPNLEYKGERIKVLIKSAGIASEAGTDKPYKYFETEADGEAAGYVGEVMQDPGEIQDTYEETENLALNTEDDGKPKYRPVFMSTNAITLSHRIQIVLRFYGEPDQIHENYDFVHCTNYWTSWDSKLVLRQDALEALLAKDLRYVGSKYPVCSVFRLRKFIRRGWTINAGQILKMCMQISALDLLNVPTLEDQLTGVDAAYFLEVISKMKDKDPQRIDTAYLVEILDRLF